VTGTPQYALQYACLSLDSSTVAVPINWWLHCDHFHFLSIFTCTSWQCCGYTTCCLFQVWCTHCPFLLLSKKYTLPGTIRRLAEHLYRHESTCSCRTTGSISDREQADIARAQPQQRAARCQCDTTTEGRSVARQFGCPQQHLLGTSDCEWWPFVTCTWELGGPVQRFATGRTVRGSSPGAGEIFRTRPDWPCGPPSLLSNGYRVIPCSKAAAAWRWPPTPSRAEVKEKVDLYLYPPVCLHGLLWGALHLDLYLYRRNGAVGGGDRRESCTMRPQTKQKCVRPAPHGACRHRRFTVHLTPLCLPPTVHWHVTATTLRQRLPPTHGPTW
jgi:hypothetical protein